MYGFMLIAQKTAALLSSNRKVRYALYAALTLVLGYEAFTLGTHFGEFAYYIIH